MVVLILQSVSEQLRYDVTRWLNQVGIGVYVGHVNAHIRERLWSKVVASCKDGEAILIWSTNREQGYQFYVYNSSAKVLDLNGFHTLLYPLPEVTYARQTSVTTKMQRNKAVFCSTYAKSLMLSKDCVVMDIETTGLDSTNDSILEIGALKIRNHQVVDTFQIYIKQDKPIPVEIVELTQITDDMVKQGCSLATAIFKFREFIGIDLLVGYNVKFDLEFIQQAIRRLHESRIRNRCADVFILMKKFEPSLSDYRLESVFDFLQTSGQLIQESSDFISHRALDDCEKCRQIYKLMYDVAKQEMDKD